MVRIKMRIEKKWKYVVSGVVKKKFSFVVKFVGMEVVVGMEMSIVSGKMFEKMVYFCVYFMFKMYYVQYLMYFVKRVVVIECI